MWGEAPDFAPVDGTFTPGIPRVTWSGLTPRLSKVPGLNSRGTTCEELLDNLRDALDEALEMNRRDARAAAVGSFEEVGLALGNGTT